LGSIRSLWLSALHVLVVFTLGCDDSSNAIPNDTYKSTSGIAKISTDSQTVENLVVLGRIWGFLKYYHPVVASGKYNWDYELFKIMPNIITAKTPSARNDVLSAWIDTLGTFAQDSIRSIDSSTVAQWPDYSWINEASLGKNLAQKLNLIRTAKRDGKCRYVNFSVVNSTEFRDEPYYDSLQFPDAGYRILCLFRYWNIIEYYFPYKHLIDRPWSSILSDYVPQFASCTNELEYELCIIRMSSEINDSHAFITGDINAFSNYRGHFSPLIRLSMIEGKAVVTGFCTSKIEKESGLQCGDVIVAVDGVTIDSLYKERKINIRSSNEWAGFRDFCRSILTSKDSIVHIEYENNDVIYQRDLACYDHKDSVEFSSYYDVDSAIYLVRSDIACIFPGLITNDILSNSLKKFDNTKGIVIDLRCYPQQKIVEQLSNYLFPHPIAIGTYFHTDNITPGLFRYSDNEVRGSDNPNYYKGRVAILINEETQSEAEHHVMVFQHAPSAIVIGSPTAGANGNLAEVNLPGGINTAFSGLGVAYLDHIEPQRTGIIPDIEVHPTIKGIREGRDELMEAAIDYINR
jgi:hypothetical protein